MQTQAEHDWRRTLDLPADLREPLADLARQNERSTAAEIRLALREHVERAKSPAGFADT
jgi:hypothetical protein